MKIHKSPKTSMESDLNLTSKDEVKPSEKKLRITYEKIDRIYSEFRKLN